LQLRCRGRFFCSRFRRFGFCVCRAPFYLRKLGFVSAGTGITSTGRRVQRPESFRRSQRALLFRAKRFDFCGVKDAENSRKSQQQKRNPE
jgi:hypothetical protein